MLVSTFWPYYCEMERKENYRRLMAACVRKVYDIDNDKNIIHLGQRSPRCLGPRPQPIKPIGKSGTASESDIVSKWSYKIIYGLLFQSTITKNVFLTRTP